MADAGYSGKPLRDKLGLKLEHRCLLLNVPDNVLPSLEPIPTACSAAIEPGKELDFVLMVPRDSEELARLITLIEKALSGTGMLWVAWPKKASKLPTDLDFNIVQTTGLAAGLVDTKICAVNQDYSGLKFLRRKDDLRRKG